jgi:hypothetical protein
MKVTPKRLLIAALVVVAALVAYLLFGRSAGGLRIQVQVSGTASDTQSGAGGAYRASGTGVAPAPFGNVTLGGAGTGQLELNCVVFDGDGELVTAAGDLRLRLAKPAKACLNRSSLGQSTGLGVIAVQGTVEATGTSGSLLGRRGNLRAQGSFDADTGSFTVTFSGRLHR